MRKGPQKKMLKIGLKDEKSKNDDFCDKLHILREHVDTVGVLVVVGK